MLAEAYWAAGRREQRSAAYERTRRLAEWNAFSAGPVRRRTLAFGRARARRGDDRGRQRLAGPALGPDDVLPADREHRRGRRRVRAMIEQRDPFAVIFAWAKITQPLREHSRWAKIAAAMRLEDGTSRG